MDSLLEDDSFHEDEGGSSDFVPDEAPVRQTLPIKLDNLL